MMYHRRRYLRQASLFNALFDIVYVYTYVGISLLGQGKSEIFKAGDVM